MKRTGSNSIVQQLISHNSSNTSSLTKTTRQYYSYNNRYVFNSSPSSKSNNIIFNNWIMKDVVPNSKLFGNTITFGQIRCYTTTNWLKEKEASTNDSDGTNTSAPSSEQITLDLTDCKNEWVAKLARERSGFISISSDMQRRLEGEICEWLRMERANPKYDYLRNLQDPTKMKKLETLIGSNIELPIFEQADLVPKYFDPKAKYLFTRQRFDILKRVVSGEKGFVFSGPYGISKSYALYLIAAYAFVNSIPVLYIPKCAIWKNCYFSNQKHGANQYLLESFLSLNNDILSPSVLSELEQSDNIVYYLSRQVAQNKPVFYLFDEHHELFIPDTKGNIIATEPYFQDFIKWTGSTDGSKTMTIYCGSGHSTFEDYLPVGESTKIVKIVPPTATEFETLVADFGLDPSDKRIEFVTGRTPRILKNLAYFLRDKDGTDDDFNNFINSSWNNYISRLSNMYKKLTVQGKKSFFSTAEGLFTLALHSGRPTKVDSIVYDQGLLYKDSSEKLFIVNEPAKRCLFEFYCFHFPISGIPASISASKKGALFKQYLLMQEFSIEKHVGTFYTTNNKNIPIQQTISYEINTHQSLSLTDMRVLDAINYPKGTGVLFVPESKIFPSFDYAIIMYCGEKVEIILKQTTISTVDSHYCHNTSCKMTDLSNLLTPQYYIEKGQAMLSKSLKVPKPYLFSLLELILRGVINERKVNSEEVTVEKKEKDGTKKLLTLNLEPNKQQLHFIDKKNTLVKSITYGDIQFTWHYVYESGTDGSHQSVKKVKENGILYRNRQEIAERMKVFFK
ncbi:hypothetical protein C9374_010559 [Naegleria lovaniensis]|uniref:Uncharacterized protein n=1 Tax=Naegleria lovaniensis TaxID=51637 RepID=A0AA88GG21_NAELO|nr:uncharacterized protein C9374_010559 [Naegleria lovaniensis]KAG2374815.1 hypothetical protein C9374_010559 [Naegleria lovaniensis]